MTFSQTWYPPPTQRVSVKIWCQINVKKPLFVNTLHLKISRIWFLSPEIFKWTTVALRWLNLETMAFVYDQKSENPSWFIWYHNYPKSYSGFWFCSKYSSGRWEVAILIFKQYRTLKVYILKLVKLIINLFGQFYR